MYFQYFVNKLLDLYLISHFHICIAQKQLCQDGHAFSKDSMVQSGVAVNVRHVRVSATVQQSSYALLLLALHRLWASCQETDCQLSEFKVSIPHISPIV